MSYEPTDAEREAAARVYHNRTRRSEGEWEDQHWVYRYNRTVDARLALIAAYEARA